MHQTIWGIGDQADIDRLLINDGHVCSQSKLECRKQVKKSNEKCGDNEITVFISTGWDKGTRWISIKTYKITNFNINQLP